MRLPLCCNIFVINVIQLLPNLGLTLSRSTKLSILTRIVLELEEYHHLLLQRDFQEIFLRMRHVLTLSKAIALSIRNINLLWEILLVVKLLLRHKVIICCKRTTRWWVILLNLSSERWLNRLRLMRRCVMLLKSNKFARQFTQSITHVPRLRVRLLWVLLINLRYTIRICSQVSL